MRANRPRPNARLLRRFTCDERAASAVEFALILPVLLVLLLGSFDVARAIEVKTKITTLARTLSEFVAQSKTIRADQLASAVNAATTVLSPYPASADELTLNIASIRKIDGTDKIDWSYPPPNSLDREAGMVLTEQSAVIATVRYVHRLNFASFVFGPLGLDTITLSASSSSSPRWGGPVAAEGF